MPPSLPSDVMTKSREHPCSSFASSFIRADDATIDMDTCDRQWTSTNYGNTRSRTTWNRHRKLHQHNSSSVCVQKSLLPYSSSSSCHPSNLKLERELSALCFKVIKLLECPVCFDTIYAPILQCANGHVFCHKCCPQLQERCPVCRLALDPPIRNRCLESVLSVFSFPCRFRCNAFVSFDKMLDHERHCLLRELQCPCAGCSWTGRDIDVVGHLLGGHSRILNLNGDQIVFLATEINVPGKRLNWMMIQHCFKHHFLLLLERCHRDLVAEHVKPNSIHAPTIIGEDATVTEGSRNVLNAICRTDDLDSEYVYWATVQLISTDISESDQFRYRMELEDKGSRIPSDGSDRGNIGVSDVNI